MAAGSGFIPPERPTSRNQFRVAILCALTIEADAVEALFDHIWDDLEENQRPLGKVAGDPNSYTLGVIGRHNVVLAHMPSMGVASAASVASSCKMSFPQIKLGAVVGVCGVVPGSDSRNRERVLGDVIISTGVIHYDAGRITDDGFKRRTNMQDNLGRLPADMRSLLHKLEGLRSRRELEAQMLGYLKTLQDIDELEASYPGKAHDVLFAPEYKHGQDQAASQDKQCHELGCNGTVVVRQRLLAEKEDPIPSVHFGIIASGSSVMKTAGVRDETAKRDSVIAFEMEGAGAWDSFPCVVIKGFCDYADSHKNKRWQLYAAAVAASCAKAFLWSWTPSDTEEEYFNARVADQRYLKLVVRHLSAQASDDKIRTKSRMYTDWLWNHDVFQEWNKSDGIRHNASDTWLTVKDKAFTGKSVLMKEVIISKLKDAHTITLYHFFHGGNTSGRSEIKFLRNILSQLLRQVQVKPWPEIREWGDMLESNEDVGLASVDMLMELIKGIISDNKESIVSEKDIRIFVDGVDECSDAQDHATDDDGGPLRVLQFLQSFVEHSASAGIDARVCISRRPFPEFSVQEPPTKTISLEDYTSVEVSKYVHARLAAIENNYERIKILGRLQDNWSDDFHWATFVTSEILKNQNNMEHAERIAAEVPSDHESLYAKAIYPLKASPHKNEALLKLLQLNLAAWRPLTVDELHQALAYSTTKLDFDVMSEWEDSTAGLPAGVGFEKYVQRESHGFLEITEGDPSPLTLTRSDSLETHLDGCSRVGFAHHSVEKFLRSDAGLARPHDKQYCLESECHQLLLTICLRILNRCTMEDDVDAGKGIQLRDYACEFWLRHAQRCRKLPADLEIPQFLVKNCRRAKTKRLLKEQVRFLSRSGALESLLFEWEDEEEEDDDNDNEPIMMAVLLATMGCTELLQRHLAGCKPCKKMLNPVSKDQEPSQQNIKSMEHYRAALQNAIMGSWTETALFLLEHYPLGDINTLFDDRTLLYHASYFACETDDPAESASRMKCVSFLLARGADAAVQSPFWWEYPLHIAIRNDSKSLMKILLQGATPAQAEAMFKARRTIGGRTALHFAIACDDNSARLETLEALLEFAPRNVGLLDIRDDDGHTVMELARDAGEDAKQLLEHLEDFRLDEEEEDD
ncbi:hypothetical protein VHEMI06456 [[Torrubiella] hemipterigena]|uniref:Nephrocystin 3-like N-terminal domain-containing protein n=1 Tax=[Torrubiella] hemipterigena TaxID=1531966 RepID=A0A0A1T0R1_9HYPO|nr:hypothetical protein VHEMI06456 [[Torrubiella] hemipterigena]